MSESALERELRAAAELAEAAARVEREVVDGSSLASTAAPVAAADYPGLPADARAALPSAEQLREALDLDYLDPGP